MLLIKTTANPSTPKRFSSKIELKGIAMKFAERNKLVYKITERFLIEVDRLKSLGTLCDMDILVAALKAIEAEVERKY